MTAKEFNILIPTDFSDNAWQAARYALELYADQVCKIYLLNSLALSHVESRAYMTTRYVDTLSETSLRGLNEVKTRAMALNNKNHTFDVITTSEDLVVAIKRATQLYKIDLVVAGTKGASGISKFFLGSNAVKIIQNLETCPMLAVPDGETFKVPKHIAFPTDYNRSYKTKEMQVLLDFADLFKAHIYVLHINLKDDLNEVQLDNMNELKSQLVNHKHTFHWMEKSGTKSDEITEFVSAFEIDLLAMVNYKHSFIENLVKEPVIKKIGFQPTVPFLVIPE